MARAVVVAVVLGLLTATAYAAPPPGSSRQERRDYYALQLIDGVAKRVERDRACRSRPPESGPVAAAPSAAFLNSFAPLRRAARPDENVTFPSPSDSWSLPVYSGYARVLDASTQVFPLHDVSTSSPRPRRCVARLRSGVRRAAAKRTRVFRRDVSRLLKIEIGRAWAPRRREGLALLVDRSFGTTTDLSRFRRHGLLALQGNFTDPAASIHGAVPDGVASIDFTFGQVHHFAVTVHDNAVALSMPLTLSQTANVRQVWRAADGHVIRVVSGL